MSATSQRPLAEGAELSLVGAEVHELIQEVDDFRTHLMSLRRRTWLRANRMGATYDVLATSAGVHPSLINLELRKAREDESGSILNTVT